MNKTIIIIGLAIASIGVLWQVLQKFPFGRLPGDIVIRKDSFSFYMPITTMIIISLVIWFVCSFGLGILLRPMLAGIKIGGTDLGFWFAQQGSIIVFLVLIFVYAWRMNKIDKEFGVDE